MRRGDEDEVIERRSADGRIFLSICSLAVTAAIQIAGGIWWAANISADLRHNTEAINDVKATSYTKDDARRDFRNVDLQVSEAVRRIGVVEQQAVPERHREP